MGRPRVLVKAPKKRPAPITSRRWGKDVDWSSPVLLWCQSCRDVVEQNSKGSNRFTCLSKGHSNTPKLAGLFGEQVAIASRIKELGGRMK